VTYLGAGLTKAGAKAAAKGTAKKTLGAAAKAGQKSALTLDVPFVKSLQGIPLLPKAADEAILGGLTKAGQAIKSIPTGGGSDLGTAFKKAFGTRITGKGARTIDELEELVNTVEGGEELVKTYGRKGAQGAQEAIARILKPLKDYQKLVKKGVVKDADGKLAIARKLVNPKDVSIKIPKQAEKIVTSLSKALDDYGKVIKDAGLDTLEGKVMPSLIKKEVRMPGTKIIKEVGKDVPLEKWQGHFKLVDESGRFEDIVFAKNPSATAGSIAEEGKYLKLKDSDRWVTREGYNRVQELQAQRQKILGEIEDVASGKLKVRKSKADHISELIDRKNRIEDSIKGIERSGLKRVAAQDWDVNAAYRAANKPAPFEIDPFMSIISKGRQAGELSARQRFVKDAAAKFGRRLRSGESIPEGFAKVKVKGLEDYVFPVEVADTFNQVHKAYSSVDSVSEFVKTFDKLQNLWKGTATYLNVGFHARNGVSNLWQIHLANGFDSLRGIEDVAKAHTTMWKANKLRRAGKTTSEIAKEIGGKEGKLYKRFIDTGSGGTGAFYTDIPRAAKGQNKWFEMGAAAGNWVEDSAKFGLFKERVGKGFTDAAAAKDVRKFLFDYGDLTDIEKQIFKRVMPFYTWTRKNIPLQVAMLIEKPGKFSSLWKVKHAIESSVTGEPLDERLLPDWLKDGYNVFVGQQPGGMANYIRLEGFLPSVDISRIGRPGEETLGMLSPFIKTPVELMTNYNFFYESQIKESEADRKPFFGMDVPILSKPGIAHIIDNIRPIGELERLTGVDRRASDAGPTWLKFLSGLNIKGFDKKKQENVYDMVLGQELKKIKKAEKKARKDGDRGRVDELRELEKLLKMGKKEIKL